MVGSLILSPLLYFIYLLIPTSPGVPWYQRLGTDWSPILFASILIVFLTYSTLIGLIGSSVLLNPRVDLGGIDTSNASLAGALGGIL